MQSYRNRGGTQAAPLGEPHYRILKALADWHPVTLSRVQLASAGKISNHVEYLKKLCSLGYLRKGLLDDGCIREMHYGITDAGIAELERYRSEHPSA